MSDREYDNTNRGVLFKNAKKENDRHADYRGNINVDGKEFWLDAWIKKSKDGKTTFLSLSVKPKLAREHQGAPDNPPAQYANKGQQDPF